jgi:hypothetical protein
MSAVPLHEWNAGFMNGMSDARARADNGPLLRTFAACNGHNRRTSEVIILAIGVRPQRRCKSRSIHDVLFRRVVCGVKGPTVASVIAL